MENTCLHCNTTFPYRRVSRKYCSNSCKQLDYYNRKREFKDGYLGQPEKNMFIVKEEDFTVKPFTVKEKRAIVKPLSVKKELSSENISEEQLEALAEKILLLLEERIDEIIYRKTLNVKDALSVKENLNVKDTVKEAFTVKTDEFIVKENDISVKDNVKEDELIVKETLGVNDSVKETREYKFIKSGFIDSITEHLNRNNSDALSKFLYPHLYWTASYTANVKWVSLRFRCLLENLIWFSKFGFIDREDFCCFAEAFTSLENSKHFKAFGNDYPHKDLIKELKGKINSMLNASQHLELVRLHITPKMKAELIATKFEIGNFVPKINFSELDFSE